MIMDNLLQAHGAKHVYRVPEGLGELCSDISREVLRTQPRDIYRYIAEYTEALLITRENAKVAVRVVNNILLGSEAIVGILHGTGLSLGQIAVAAPKLQNAFRTYLDTVAMQPVQPCQDKVHDAECRTSIGNILESTGATLEKAEGAATIIQTAFRGHYERMVEREANGEIQWQRAASNTMEILKKAGVSQAEATNAAMLVQSAYRGYYTRRNEKLKYENKDQNPADEIPSSLQTIQAVAWLDMMYDDSELTPQRANEAATLIQTAYRGFNARRRRRDVERTLSANSVVADAIVENVRRKIFEKVLSREDIPREFGTQREVEVAADKIENAYIERLRQSRLSSQTDTDGIYETEGDDADVDPLQNRDNNNEIHHSVEIVDGSTALNPTEETMHSHQ